MKLNGSCHCGAVTFSVESKTPYPYMRCYCSICRKTAGGGGYAINIMGETATLKVRGARNIAVYRARIKEERSDAHDAVESAPPLLREVRERTVGLGPAMGGLGVSVRVGDRYTAAQAAGRRRDHA